MTYLPLTVEQTAGLPPTATPPLEYEDWMIGLGLRPNTISQRVGFAQWRWREWGTWDLPAATIGAWLSGYSGWTALTYHSHLTSIYRWLNETGAIDVSPLRTLRKPPTPEADPKPLDLDEVDAVMDGVTGNLRAWMLLARLAGLRVHEIAKIQGEDVTKRMITCDGKGGKRATIPTHPELWDLAQTYPRRGMWFPSPLREGLPYSANHISTSIANRFREVGIAEGSVHRLRATYGTTLLRGGVNVRVVQKLMRHSSLNTTVHYLGVDEDELTAAIRTLAA